MKAIADKNTEVVFISSILYLIIMKKKWYDIICCQLLLIWHHFYWLIHVNLNRNTDNLSIKITLEVFNFDYGKTLDVKLMFLTTANCIIRCRLNNSLSNLIICMVLRPFSKHSCDNLSSLVLQSFLMGNTLYLIFSIMF